VYLTYIKYVRDGTCHYARNARLRETPLAS
jgi:hypothetical protein